MDLQQQQQEQQQQQRQSTSSTIPNSPTNKTEQNRAYSLVQHHNSRNLKNSPTSQTSNAHNLSIISLSKLKNYMPQNKMAAHLFQCSSSSLKQPSSVVGSVANIGCYRGSALDQTNQSLYHYSNNEKLARAKPVSLSSHFSNNSRTITDRINPPPQESSGFQQTTANQVLAETQQKQEHQQQEQRRSDSITDPQSRFASTNRSSKGVDLKGAVEEAASEVRDHQLVASREERKQEKIDTRDRAKSTSAESDNNSSSGNNHKEVEVQRGSYTRNNMTPSSLLLLQNHNYIEQQQQHQQQQRIIGAQYHNDHNQQGQGDESLVIGQTRASIANSCSDRGSSGSANKQSDDQHQSQTHGTDQALSSSSLMLTNINQFKSSDSIGNSSINNSSNNQTSASSTANIVDSSDYSIQGLNQIHNQSSEADVLTSSSSINNLQQNYNPSSTTCDFKAAANTGEAQFVQYGIQTNRNLSNVNNYHESFQAANMLEQQIKLENVVSSRNLFEGSNSHVDHNLHGTGNSNIEPSNVARDLARQQARTSINQYYSNHYNLMPTNSSKSTSPTSSTSTPSPKTNAMHQPISQHQNQLILTASNPAPQIHLDHLNHHYMGNNATVSGLNHQQHHVNQHYAYNQTATGGTVHHQMAVSGHDQGYTHQQTQQHQHHQMQPQHSQQLQQHQQQHNQHQQHHHQNVANQSIYHQLANNAANVNVNHIYCNSGSSTHYQGHMQSNSGTHQQNHLMSEAHQNHLNTAAAACAAAAVVSQTLKTVANQQSQQHHYGNAITNSFGPSSGSLMNMTAQHHTQFHTVNQLNHHHLTNQTQVAQHTHQQQQSLPVHHTTSIVSRKYQCKMCPQVFMSKAELKYHNQNHMREAKPYKCLQCPKAFANSSYLSQHMRIHQGVKPYTCDICSRKFTQLSHLQQHKRTHTGDKPYKCNYMNCTKQFSQLSNLQSHSRCHQLDKPYKCNSCYKCFHDEQSLLEHIPRHLESKHLKKNLCIFCGSSYQQERGLVKHFQQYHTDKAPTLVAAAIAAGTTGNTSLIASLVSSTSANAFATPSSGGGSSSCSSSSVSSSGSLNVHSNNINVAHGASAAFGTTQY